MFNQRIVILIMLLLASSSALAIEYIRSGTSISYVWVDKDGVKHFSSQKPEGINGVEIKTTNYPIYGPSPGWILLENISSPNNFWEYQILDKNKNVIKVWVQISSLKEASDITSYPTVDIKHLYEFNCSTKQRRTLQSSFRTGNTYNSIGETDWKFVEPDTSESNLFAALCKSKPSENN
jgi:hypothetical protein